MIVAFSLIFTRAFPAACPLRARWPFRAHSPTCPGAASRLPQQLPGSLPPSGYPGDHPCPTKGAAIQSHYDEDQCMLQRGTLGVRQERYGEAELH
jgi:hypothetical protein